MRSMLMLPLAGAPLVIGTALGAVYATPGSRVTYCHATGSETNPYVQVTTSTAAFYQSGHIDHDGDVYPAGSHRDQSWQAQGDLSLLATGCTVDVPDEDPTDEEPEEPEEPVETDDPENPDDPGEPCPDDSRDPVTCEPLPNPTPTDPEQPGPGQPTTGIDDEQPADDPTPLTPDGPAPVETRTEHRFNCDSHVRLTYVKIDGRWVVADRVVTPLDACLPGQTEPSFKEEGL